MPDESTLSLSFMGSWKRDGGPTRQDLDLRQSLKLPFRGSLLDPRIVSYDFSLRPMLTQQFSEGVERPLQSQQLGWDVGLRLLSTAPVSLALSTNRSSGSSAGALDSRGDFSSSTFAAAAHFALPALPLSLRWSDRSTENRWFSGTAETPVAWSDDTKSLRLAAQNSKLDASLERLWFDDRIGSRDFVLDRAALNHRLRWGKGSRLQTLLDRSHRRGAAAYERRAWQENLHLQHTRGTASDLYYRRFGTETPDGGSSERSLGVRFRSRLSDALTLGLHAGSRDTRYNGTRERVTSVSPEVDATFGLPFGGRLTLGARVGYERRDLELLDAAPIPVLDEEHTVPETRTFTLEHPGAEAESVVLVGPGGLVEYIEGLDYLLVPVDTRVEVVIPLESRIEVGDRVLVSYRYVPLELPEGDLYVGAGSAALAFGRVSLVHSRTLRRSPEGTVDAPAMEGARARVFGTLDETFTGLSANLPTPLGRWEVEVSHRNRTSSAIDFQSVEAATTLAPPTGTRLRLTLGAAARGTRDPGGWLSSRSAHASANWRLPGETRVGGRLQGWELDLGDGLMERSLGGDVNLSLRMGATETWIRYQFNLRTEPAPFRVQGLQVRLVRRF